MSQHYALSVATHVFQPNNQLTVLFLKVSGNLLCGSGGGEGTGKANDDHVLALGVLGDVDLLNVREALEELDGGELVTGGDVEGGGGTGVRQGGREGSGTAGQGGGEKELHGCEFLGFYSTTSVELRLKRVEERWSTARRRNQANARRQRRYRCRRRTDVCVLAIAIAIALPIICKSTLPRV